MDISLIVSSFIAGILMFLAPCTLPLVPGYLAFIAGVDQEDIHEAQKDSKAFRKLRSQVFFNGVMYVLGFTLVFVLFGVLAAFIGANVLAPYRTVLIKVGGIIVVIFGLFMLDIVKISFLQKDSTVNVPSRFKKGHPGTSFLLGSAFAIGWAPCIGPILASVLLLASTSATALEGGILLAIFSLGMGIPFLMIAWGIGSAYARVKKINVYMPIISKIGGVFLIVLGILLFTNNLGLLIAYGYEWFGFLGYEQLLDYY